MVSNLFDDLAYFISASGNHSCGQLKIDHGKSNCLRFELIEYWLQILQVC